MVSTVTYAGASGTRLYNVCKATTVVSAGRTFTRSCSFRVTEEMPRSTYLFTVTATDDTGSVTSNTPFMVS